MSGEKEPIRVGLVGLGRAGWGMHCPELDTFPEQFRIVAACDPVKQRRDLIIDRYPACRTYRRYEDLLLDADVELVDIATRSGDHFDHALAALKAGKWTLIEKPMCLDFEDALKLRAASIKSGNRLFVRHNRRFDPTFLHIREVIASGLLGEVYDVRGRFGRYQRRDDWQTVKRCGGGMLLNWGPHLIDAALQLVGMHYRLVWCEMKRVAAVGDAEDFLRLVLRNNAGLTVDVEVSGGRVMQEPEWTVTGTRGGLSASNGTLQLRYLDPSRKLPRRRASVRTPPHGSFGTAETLHWIEKTVPVAPAAPSGATRMWDYLHGAIRLNRPYPVTLDQAVEVMRVITLARKESPLV
jgi:predicted dehydrogenase